MFEPVKTCQSRSMKRYVIDPTRPPPPSPPPPSGTKGAPPSLPHRPPESPVFPAQNMCVRRENLHPDGLNFWDRVVGSKDPCHFLPGGEGHHKQKKGGRGSPSQVSKNGGSGEKPDLCKRVDRLSDVKPASGKGGWVPQRVPWQGVLFSGSGGGVWVPRHFFSWEGEGITPFKPAR
jgi:hypothetical protein